MTTSEDHEHAFAFVPDLEALGADVSAATGEQLAVVWRHQQVVDGEEVPGLVRFVDAAGETVAVPSAVVATALSGLVPPKTPAERLLEQVDGATTLPELKAIVAGLVETFFPA